MKLGERDASGRPRPVPVDGSEFVVETDTVIIAVGQAIQPGVIEGADTDARGCIQVDEETMATSIEGIYAGGDFVHGGDTAVRAVGDGKKAAFAMDEYMKGRSQESEVRINEQNKEKNKKAGVRRLKTGVRRLK